ncbi:MAG: O-antigen ligase family protein [Solirubrobacterales bacterium]
MSASRPGYRRTRVGLLGAAFLAPFSATHIAGPLTVGRGAALAFAVLLALDILRERPPQFRIDLPAVLLVGAYIGITGWIYLNKAAWGCNCQGRAGGFVEFATIGVLALIAISFEPRLRQSALIAALCGLVLAAMLALAGAGSINSGTVDLTRTGGRLSGTYGNANELGFAAAMGIVIALAYLCAARDRLAQLALAASLLVLGLTLALTFSRGSIVAVGAGAISLALRWAWGVGKRLMLVFGTATVMMVIAAILYSAFEQNREEASFESIPTSLSGLSQRDESGWDSRGLGPIPHGPSTLLNHQGAIVVRSTRSGEGASLRWGEASSRNTYILKLRARTTGALAPFRFALGDSSNGSARAMQSAALEDRWRRFSLIWHPRIRSPHATLYLWQAGGPGTFEFSDVRVLAIPPIGARTALVQPRRLTGSLYRRLTSTAARAEQRYLQSRIDAAHEALDAFVSQPLRGIGWGTFPSYAAAHLDYGPLAAHNQYLAFAAELGIIGALLIAVLVAAAVTGIRRTGPDPGDAAAVAVLAATAAGLIFIEALPAPQISISVGLALAIVCANQRASTSSEISDPPLREDSSRR